MKVALIMLLVAGSFLWSLYRRFKRTLAETVDVDTGDEQTFDEQDAVYEETATPSAPYFSYEYDMPADTKNMASPKPQPATAAKPQPVVSAERPLAFDLRQAVIYQTLLNNPYLEERNQ